MSSEARPCPWPGPEQPRTVRGQESPAAPQGARGPEPGRPAFLPPAARASLITSPGPAAGPRVARAGPRCPAVPVRGPVTGAGAGRGLGRRVSATAPCGAGAGGCAAGTPAPVPAGSSGRRRPCRGAGSPGPPRARSSASSPSPAGGGHAAPGSLQGVSVPGARSPLPSPGPPPCHRHRERHGPVLPEGSPWPTVAGARGAKGQASGPLAGVVPVSSWRPRPRVARREGVGVLSAPRRSHLLAPAMTPSERAVVKAPSVKRPPVLKRRAQVWLRDRRPASGPERTRSIALAHRACLSGLAWSPDDRPRWPGRGHVARVTGDRPSGCAQAAGIAGHV